MEKVAEFNDNNGFKVTLTTDKIYISAIGAEETFALRSVSGVGLYDDITKYNQELENFKRNSPKVSRETGTGILIAIAVFVLILSFFTAPGEGPSGIQAISVAIAALGIWFWFRKPLPEPVLDSYFTLMLSGGDRRFPFNKSGSNAKQIAEFINKVEDTLTAYHKG